ncbi:MAG: thiol:disulfide interchange protein DsbA/DsbL [Betaproteobacteria bacterium]|nr:thiol:disulfide interchange protein DsbA/DsbL [Betaproteobacteria bacterium]MDH3436100.1 thiol:disulfide interchange protein DsbA/DsbL [Betaproteobacteria bacterium]
MHPRRRFLLFTTLLAGLVIASSASAQFIAGKDYLIINPPQPTDSGNKVEVLEFFWYGCPHCNALQPSLDAWVKRKPADVEFRRVPAVLGQSWMPLTQAFYTFEALGLTAKLHHDVFAAIHKDKVRLQDPKTLFEWVAKHGVDQKKFEDTYNSFGVRSRVQRAIDMSRTYNIPGTPALVIDGRYLTAPHLGLGQGQTLSYERYFKLVDHVVAVARKARAGK